MRDRLSQCDLTANALYRLHNTNLVRFSRYRQDMRGRAVRVGHHGADDGRIDGHISAGLRSRHDGIRTGHRVRVHGARRSAGQHTRHAHVDRLPGGLPLE